VLVLASGAPAAAQTATGVLGTHVQTIQTSQYAPSSPDPAGIVYVAASDRFLISDSEVDEMAIYRGKNLFTAARTGGGGGSGTTYTFSREPSGLGYDAAKHILFVSDDDRDRIYLDRPGADGVHGTADDSVTSFSTVAFGSTDAEDVEYDPRSGHVFVANGAGADVYDIDPVNSVFGDGDDVAMQFDVARYGARDAEGLGLDLQRNVLVVVDPTTKSLYELTKTGALVRIVDCHGISGTNRMYSDVAIAPTSNPTDEPARLDYWIVDRQADNGSDTNENDGKLYEVSGPPPAEPPPALDRTRPNTRITARPSRTATARRAVFRFVASEARSAFWCRLDRGVWRPCASPKRYRGLRRGVHTFRVRARDRAGNFDPTPATWRWRVRRPART